MALVPSFSPAELNSLVCTHHILFSHPSADGPLCCLHVLAVAKSTDVSTGVWLWSAVVPPALAKKLPHPKGSINSRWKNKWMPGDPREGRGPAQSPQASRSLQEDPLGPQGGERSRSEPAGLMEPSGGPSGTQSGERSCSEPAGLSGSWRSPSGPGKTSGSPRHPRAEGLDVRVQAGGARPSAQSSPASKPQRGVLWPSPCHEVWDFTSSLWLQSPGSNMRIVTNLGSKVTEATLWLSFRSEVWGRPRWAPVPAAPSLQTPEHVLAPLPASRATRLSQLRPPPHAQGQWGQAAVSSSSSCSASFLVCSRIPFCLPDPPLKALVISHEPTQISRDPLSISRSLNHFCQAPLALRMFTA